MRLESFSAEEVTQIRNRIPMVEQALKDNLKALPQAHGQILLAGADYPGCWLEHNQDNVFLADANPQAAWNSIRTFVRLQRKDGLFPFCLPYRPNTPNQSAAIFNQLQIVYPLPQCALDIARKTVPPEGLLKETYEASVRYDSWLMTNRDSSGKGLVDMFCEFDTGHDNDPRVIDGGIPKCCPDMDAANMPDLPCMPIVSVDLSAMLYGHRRALAELARRLLLPQEAADWSQKAEETRIAINQLLYDPEDDFFYDRAPQGLRKYRTEHITRLFLNRVLTQDQFDSIWDRYFTTPAAGFLPDYPFPAVAVDDPHFDETCPHNSWASNSQALTALRAVLWMDFYNRSEELTALLSIWLKAFLQNGFTFTQELNPFNGKAVGDATNYTPSLLLFQQAVKRLKL